ncbi:MAG: hypothetical protein ABIN79_12205 [Marmoricola sp.]
MTPTSHPAGFRGRRPAVLVQAVVWVVVVATVTTVAGGLLDGSSGAGGAAVGGLLSLSFFTFGSVIVNMATRLAPEAAMVVALTTYTLQVVLVVIAFALIRASGALGETLSAEWLAVAVVAATLAWTVGQVVATVRSRVPVYDIELPRAVETAPLRGSRDPEAGAS